MRSATTASGNAQNYAHRNNHLLQNIEGTNRVRNGPSRNRRTDEVPFIAGCSHMTRKNKGSCSGFLPNTKPMQHSCSHYNAISNHSFRKRTELRTQEQSLVAKYRRNQSRPERPQPQPPHRRGTFHRRLQPLYTEKRTVSFSGFLPKT